jgi:hypothetical protein
MHGGKDRHPFPAPVAVYDETSGCSCSEEPLCRDDELAAPQRLDDRLACSKAVLPARLFRSWSIRSGGPQPTMAVAACSAGGRRPRALVRVDRCCNGCDPF